MVGGGWCVVGGVSCVACRVLCVVCRAVRCVSGGGWGGGSGWPGYGRDYTPKRKHHVVRGRLGFGRTSAEATWRGEVELTMALPGILGFGGPELCCASAGKHLHCNLINRLQTLQNRVVRRHKCFHACKHLVAQRCVSRCTRIFRPDQRPNTAYDNCSQRCLGRQSLRRIILANCRTTCVAQANLGPNHFGTEFSYKTTFRTSLWETAQGFGAFFLQTVALLVRHNKICRRKPLGNGFSCKATFRTSLWQTSQGFGAFILQTCASFGTAQSSVQLKALQDRFSPKTTVRTGLFGDGARLQRITLWNQFVMDNQA